MPPPATGTASAPIDVDNDVSEAASPAVTRPGAESRPIDVDADTQNDSGGGRRRPAPAAETQAIDSDSDSDVAPLVPEALRRAVQRHLLAPNAEGDSEAAPAVPEPLQPAVPRPLPARLVPDNYSGPQTLPNATSERERKLAERLLSQLGEEWGIPPAPADDGERARPPLHGVLERRRAAQVAAHGRAVSDLIEAVFDGLRGAVCAREARLSAPAAERVHAGLRTLLALARADIDAVPYRAVSGAALALYADACLLLALATLVPREPPLPLPLGARKHARAPDADARRCATCAGPLEGVHIRLKRARAGLCVPCNAQALAYARAGAADGADGADADARADEWVRQRRVRDGGDAAAPDEPPDAGHAACADAGAGSDSAPPDPRNPRAFDAGRILRTRFQPSEARARGAEPWIAAPGHGAQFVDAVKMLDLAAIVAGGGGGARPAVAAALGAELQARIARTRRAEIPDYEPFPWPRARREGAAGGAGEGGAGGAEGRPLCAAERVRELDPPPSLHAFARAEAREPFVLRAYAADGRHHPPWPALQAWTSAEYLYSRTGRARVVPVELGGSYTEAGWGQALVSWQQFLARAGWPDALLGVFPHCDLGGDMRAEEWLRANTSPDARPSALSPVGEQGERSEPAQQSETGPRTDGAEQERAGGQGSGGDEREGEGELVPVYLAQHALFRQFPALEADTRVPDYVHAAPGPEVVAAGVQYVPPPEALTNVWIGSPGVLSPAHTDPYFNCYVQVLGRKRVWVAPPSVTPHMYAYGGGETPPPPQHERDPEDGEWDLLDADEHEGESAFASLMTNTSRLPLLKPGQDTESITKAFPDFEKVLPHARETVLEPGDMLVLPPGWWHAMRQEGDTPGWSVSFWF